MEHGCIELRSRVFPLGVCFIVWPNPGLDGVRMLRVPKHLAEVEVGASWKLCRHRLPEISRAWSSSHRPQRFGSMRFRLLGKLLSIRRRSQVHLVACSTAGPLRATAKDSRFHRTVTVVLQTGGVLR